MSFPFMHANGGICCSTREGCCPNCQAKLAAEKRTLRSAEDFSPPDPYALDIAKQRARDDARHPPLTIAPPQEIHYDERGIPDPYFTTLRLAALTKQRAAIPEDGQLPLSATRDQAVAYAVQRAELDRRINAIRNATVALAAPPTLDADTQWLANLTKWRATCSAELLAIKSPIRDKDTKERADSLTFSIRLIDFGLGVSTIGPIVSLSNRIGQLMGEAGYATESLALRGPNGWRGSLKEVEQRIKTLTKQRIDAQEALDEALIDDDERTKREAEDKAFREAINTMDIKGSADGHSLRAFTKDGDPLDVADMTPAQRAAFARFEAAHFGWPHEAVTS